MKNPVTTLLLLISLFTTNISAQTTAIPDANFEQSLINLGLDIVLDGQVLTANIDTVTFLGVSSSNIADLTGIEDFSNIAWLRCANNQLTTLNLSQNTLLYHLWCSGNQLTTLDLSQNTNLGVLGVHTNLISSLDLSQNIYLRNVLCGLNPLTELDLSLQFQLIQLDCQSCSSLQCVNMKNGNNLNVGGFNATNCPNLSCIEVDNLASTANWVGSSFAFDMGVTFNTKCGPCVVGIDESLTSLKSIHPNPTIGNITIDLGEASTGSVRMLNSLGQTVFKDTFNGVTELDLSLEGPAGVYFLHLKIDGQVITKKIIKQ